eukprot:CAMPEP_0170596560 /NCGR_PEP_ID=MMETSP0224-20130122/15190_1 /TAXON_ID=285029 /ORGANISM="Togula jolla, Strain CCCM 725" /LENGTH=344 /DNA_ID=CAMNT_0010920875 /DNA_START=77 /DNA_END=1111 /DNA_ORIENTATION=+
MASWRRSDEQNRVGGTRQASPSYDTVVKNTFLHILGAENDVADDSDYLGKSSRREKSEPAQRSRSLYATGDSMCSTVLGSLSSGTQEEHTNESDSSEPVTRWLDFSNEAHNGSSEAMRSAIPNLKRKDHVTARDPVEWGEDVVTVMVRQVPRQFTQNMFLKLVNRHGFQGLFNFLYLPFDYKKRINVGYGFLNFVKPEHAHSFQLTFDGVYADRRSRTKGKPFCVHPASIQGYDANWQYFMQTKIGQKSDPHFSPLFFPEAGTESGMHVQVAPIRAKSGSGKHTKAEELVEPRRQWQVSRSYASQCMEHDVSDCVHLGTALNKSQEGSEQGQGIPVTLRLMDSV